MKYLLFGAVLLLTLSSSIRSEDEMFSGVSYNEDVTRKFNLDL
jgi:hypothetical protein